MSDYREEIQNHLLAIEEIMKNQPRECVVEFSQNMESQLQRNDHKPGWKNDDPIALLRRIREETDELEEALNKKIPTVGKIKKEAADVANFAMMIADISDRVQTEAIQRFYEGTESAEVQQAP